MSASPTGASDAIPEKESSRHLDLGAFSDPFGRLRYPDPEGDSGRRPEMLWFKEYIEVEEKAPRSIQEISADWWKHWNIPRDGGPPTGMPTHKDLMGQMSGTPAPSASFVDLLGWLVMTMNQRMSRERMPPIERLPPPPPTSELRVEPHVLSNAQRTPENPRLTPTPTPW
ncbi:MAG: hypothetical protein JXO72_13160 [Vicinamibacteria bacterium]|nr:hypothetical protein [Vicinamibacteria bacterium]